MHGLVNRSIQGFVTGSYGCRAWIAVARASGAEIGDFESLQVYDDAVTEQLLGAVERVLDKPRVRVLEDLGTWLVTKQRPDTVRRLLRFGGVDFEDFLHSLDDLPGRVRLAVPNLILPPMELVEQAPSVFLLRIGPGPGGFGALMVGLLRAMADDYGALAVLELASPVPSAVTARCCTSAPAGPEGTEEVEIRLIQADYASGRDFRLSATLA